MSQKCVDNGTNDNNKTLYLQFLQANFSLFDKGSGGGRVVKLLACGARGPGFDSHLNFRDWLSPASKSQYG